MIRLSTERLTLREFVPEDAPFVLELLNEPSFLRFIGDRGARTLAQAEAYIQERLRASYAKHGHGLLLVERKRDRAPLGMCGLVRRAGLDGPDLGFAFLEQHTGHGYATEAASAVLSESRFEVVLAITSQDNERSIRLLENLDFRFERTLTLAPSAQVLALFAWEPPATERASTAADLEGDYICPSCGERIVVPLDVAAGGTQEYVEDCPVCCSPNVLAVRVDDDGTVEVNAQAE
ncbi:MAG: CPXCG motif-containing cysteine-rich protein [Planctomycetota bacterium]